MIIPVGKNRVQQNQGLFKNALNFQGGDMFDKVDPKGRQDLIKTPSSDVTTTNPEMQQAVNDGALGNRLDPKTQDENPDLGIAGENASSIAPAGGAVVAQPSGAEIEEDPTQKDDFWDTLVNVLSPWMQKRNLMLAGSPKPVDKNTNTYDLVFMPKVDPRTGQQMKLPEVSLSDLKRDANGIAQQARGRINGVPYVDTKQMWHIPLQLGGGGTGEKLVHKAK